MKFPLLVSVSVSLLALRPARGTVIGHSDRDEVSVHRPSVRASELNSTLQSSTNASTIQWGPCDPSVVTDPSLSCGFFEIPIDYHDLSAGKGRIAVIKANATGERRGTYFMNPGMRAASRTPSS